MLVAEVRCAHAGARASKGYAGLLRVTPDGMTHRLLAQRAEDVKEHVQIQVAEGSLHPLEPIAQQVGEDATLEVEQARGA